MNQLELAQRVHLLLRVGEETPGTQPTTMDNNVGVVAEIVAWVRAAYKDIQQLHPDWLFRRGHGEFRMLKDQRKITEAQIIEQIADYEGLVPYVGDDFAYIMCHAEEDDTSAEQIVRMLSSQRFYGVQDQRPLSTGQSIFFTITPDAAIELESIPDREYVFRSFYRKVVAEFTDDPDEIPVWPSQHDMVLVYWVIVHYYCLTRDGTNQLRDKTMVNLERELRRMRNQQLPSFGM